MSEHAHDHTPVSDASEVAPGYYEIMETAVRELLVEKQLIGAGEIRRQIEVLDTRNPALGAKLVARAWTDPNSVTGSWPTGARPVKSSGFPSMTTPT